MESQWSLCGEHSGVIRLPSSTRSSRRLQAFREGSRHSRPPLHYEEPAKPLGIKWHAATYVGVWIAFATAIVLFSNLWLARFRYGPLEWLWRMATYAKRESLRRDDDESLALPAPNGNKPGRSPTLVARGRPVSRRPPDSSTPELHVVWPPKK